MIPFLIIGSVILAVFLIDYLNPKPSDETRTFEYFHYSLEIIPEIQTDNFTVILPIPINGWARGTTDFIPDEHYSPDDFIDRITSDDYLPDSEIIKTEKGWGLKINNTGKISINITQTEYIEYTNFNMQNKSMGPQGDDGDFYYWAYSDANFMVNFSIVCNAYWERFGTMVDFFNGANIDNTNINGNLKFGWNLIPGEENDSNFYGEWLE